MIYGLTLIFVVPPLESPDEPDHLNYIDFIVRTNSLPNQNNPETFINKEGHQFPLYYLLSSSLLRLVNEDQPVNIKILENKRVTKFGGYDTRVPIYNNVYNDPFVNTSSRNSFYVLRIFSLLLACITVLISYKITGFFFENHLYRYSCLFFIVTLPQFCFISSMISNDNLSNLISALAILAILKYLRAPGNISNVMILGIVAGLGLITKKTFLFIFPVLIIMNILMIYRKDISFKKTILNFLIILVFILLISGWWYYRNYTLYGEFFLTKTEMITAPFHVQIKPLLSFYFINPFIPGMFASFVGVFGWMNMPLPVFTYFVYFFFFLLTLFGYIKTFPVLLKKHKNIFSFLLLVFCFGGIIYYNTMYSQFQGRFLFPVLSVMSVMMVMGYKYLNEKYSGIKYWKYLPYIVCSLFILIDIFSIIKALYFYYDQSYYIN